MKFSKYFFVLSLIVIGHNNLFAEQNIGTAIATKVDRFVNGPSNNDRRVVALTAIGAGIVMSGLCLTIIGGHRAATGKPQKEGENEPMMQNLVTDGIARLSGFGTALLGILFTVGGSATIVMAKEAIFRLQSYMDQQV